MDLDSDRDIVEFWLKTIDEAGEVALSSELKEARSEISGLKSELEKAYGREQGFVKELAWLKSGMDQQMRESAELRLGTNRLLREAEERLCEMEAEGGEIRARLSVIEGAIHQSLGAGLFERLRNSILVLMGGAAAVPPVPESKREFHKLTLKKAA